MSGPTLHDPDRIDWTHRFWSKVAPEALSGCWLWMGAVTADGRGSAWFGGKSVTASRVSRELCHGPIGPGMFVCHRCDVPACVNPAHLFLGTHKENMRDMVIKGRSPRTIGMAQPRSKLTENGVRSVRMRAANGEQTRSITKSLGMSEHAIRAAIRREYWRHVT